MTYFTTA